jgi:hypothetical protein
MGKKGVGYPLPFIHLMSLVASGFPLPLLIYDSLVVQPDQIRY